MNNIDITHFLSASQAESIYSYGHSIVISKPIAKKKNAMSLNNNVHIH